MNRQNFEESFNSNTGSCTGQCDCGVTFYDTDNQWDWEEGEFEALEKDPKAIPLGYSIGYVEFEGRQYVVDCDCWVERAEHIIRFINGHANEIARYLNKEKKIKTLEAVLMPTLMDGD